MKSCLARNSSGVMYRAEVPLLGVTMSQLLLGFHFPPSTVVQAPTTHLEMRTNPSANSRVVTHPDPAGACQKYISRAPDHSWRRRLPRQKRTECFFLLSTFGTTAGSSCFFIFVSDEKAFSLFFLCLSKDRKDVRYLLMFHHQKGANFFLISLSLVGLGVVQTIAQFNSWQKKEKPFSCTSLFDPLY